MKKFAVITVCLNMESEIDATIVSVLNQTCTDFEYIIKDGGSKDKTVAIAESYASAFSEKGIPFRVLSCPDKGVYDAMNQAVQEVQGQWVSFINAGDRFAYETVLERIKKEPCMETADVIYGDMITRKQNQYCYCKAKPLEQIRFFKPFGHQSAFVRKELLLETPFDLRYRICADNHFFLQMYLNKKKFAYVPEAVAIFEVTGLSSDWKNSYEDMLRMHENMPVRDEEAIAWIKKIIEKKNRQEFWHQHLWRYIPESLRRKRRARKTGWKTEEEFFGTKKDNQ